MSVNLRRVTNNAVGLVANNPLSNVGTNLVVDNALDTKLNAIGSFPFWLTLWAVNTTPDTDGNMEIVEVTARPSTNNYTIVRAQQGTTGVQHNLNDNVGLFWTKGNAQEVTTQDAITAKGVLIVYTANGIPHALGPGTDGYAILADSTQTLGAKFGQVAQPSNVQNQDFIFAADTGAADVYAIAPSPAIAAYQTGQTFVTKIVHANVTTTPTINVNAKGAKTIVNPDGSALVAGQLSVGAVVQFMYDGTNMQLVSVSTSAVISYANGVFGPSASSTPQVVTHGLNKIPKKIKLTAMGNTVNGTTNISQSVGVYDASGQNVMAYNLNSNSIAAAGGFIIYVGDTAAKVWRGVIGTITSTQFTITWTDLTGGGNVTSGAIVFEVEG